MLKEHRKDPRREFSADLQGDHLHGPRPHRRRWAPPCAWGWGRLQEAQHLLGREHAGQLARLVDEHEMPPRRLRSSVTLKKNRSTVTVALMVGGCTPASVRWSWNARKRDRSFAARVTSTATSSSV